MPHRGSVVMSWRLAKHRYGITGSRCLVCNELHFPPRMICQGCGKGTEPFKFAGCGQVLSYTTIHTAPDGFEKTSPYTVALIKLKEGPVVSGHVVNAHDDLIGKYVRFIFRKLTEDGKNGVISYGFKFEIDD